MIVVDEPIPMAAEDPAGWEDLKRKVHNFVVHKNVNFSIFECRLATGRNVGDVIACRCGKPTSCPDRLCRALRQLKQQ